MTSYEKKTDEKNIQIIKVSKDNIRYIKTANQNLHIYVELDADVKKILIDAANARTTVESAPSPSPDIISDGLRIEIGTKRCLEYRNNDSRNNDSRNNDGRNNDSRNNDSRNNDSRNNDSRNNDSATTTTAGMWENIGLALGGGDNNSLQYSINQEAEIHTVKPTVFDYDDSVNARRRLNGDNTFDTMSELSVKTLSVFTTEMHHKTEKTYVAKYFGGRLYPGFCNSFRSCKGKQLYKINYTDGDSEEMSVRSFVHAAELYDVNRTIF
jgi:hypothetical protein